MTHSYVCHHAFIIMIGSMHNCHSFIYVTQHIHMWHMIRLYVRVLREAESGGEGKEGAGERQGERKWEGGGKGESHKHTDA